MLDDAKKLNEEAEAFANEAKYDDLVSKLTTMKYEIGRLKQEVDNMTDLYIFRPHIEESVRYHKATSFIMAIERRLGELGQAKGGSGYSDKYGLRALYESGSIIAIPNEELDADGRKMRKAMHSGGLVMAHRRSKASGLKVSFRQSKSETVTRYWFERKDKTEEFGG